MTTQPNHNGRWVKSSFHQSQSRKSIYCSWMDTTEASLLHGIKLSWKVTSMLIWFVICSEKQKNRQSCWRSHFCCRQSESGSSGKLTEHSWKTFLLGVILRILNIILSVLRRVLVLLVILIVNINQLSLFLFQRRHRHSACKIFIFHLPEYFFVFIFKIKLF